MIPPARVVGVGLSTPGYPSAAAWRLGTPDPSYVVPARAAVLDRACSRRASPFARAMAVAYREAAGDLPLDEIGSVFGSALGETTVMLELLGQMLTGVEEDFSPMRFAVSVHNAASGLVSISTGNRRFTTSVAADHDTPAMALLEALAVVASSNRPVVVVCGDEASPAGLVDGDRQFEQLAVAIALAPGEGPALARLEGVDRDDGRSHDPPSLDPKLAKNPQIGLLDLVNGVLHGQRGPVRLDRGRGRGYRAHLGGRP